jgi:hypothetical protein
VEGEGGYFQANHLTPDPGSRLGRREMNSCLPAFKRTKKDTRDRTETTAVLTRPDREHLLAEPGTGSIWQELAFRLPTGTAAHPCGRIAARDRYDPAQESR